MAEKINTFTIRPFSGRKDLKDAFRVNLSGPALVALKLKHGDLCQLKQDDAPPRTAIAWTATEKIQDDKVQTSKTLQEQYSLKLGDKVTIEKLNGSLPVLPHVVLWEVVGELGALSDDDKARWQGYLKELLVEAKVCLISSSV